MRYAVHTVLKTEHGDGRVVGLEDDAYIVEIYGPSDPGDRRLVRVYEADADPLNVMDVCKRNNYYPE